MTDLDPTDGELWARMAADDADAFGLLFARHGARLHGYVLRRTADPATADDLVASVFLEAWRQRRSVSLDQPSALPWLYGVAANLTRRWQRSGRRRRAALERVAGLPPRQPALVEVQAEAADEAARVLQQIRHLSARERDVLVLTVWEGLTTEEVAAALGIAPGTVRSRLSRARARLRPAEPDPPAAPVAAPLTPSNPALEA